MKIRSSDAWLVLGVIILGLAIALGVVVSVSNKYRVERDLARQELRAVLHLNPEMLPICHWNMMMDESASDQLLNSGFISIYPRDLPSEGDE